MLVFHMVQTENEKAFNLLRDLVPMQERDVLIDMDRHTVALVRDMTDVEGSDELVQFSEALQETLMSETAHQMTVGIGAAALRWRRFVRASAKPAVPLRWGAFSSRKAAFMCLIS